MIAPKARLAALAVAVVLVTVAVAIGAPLLVDHGGRVLTAPQVTAIYLGNYWATQQGASDAFHTDTFLQTWLAGPSVTGVLAQYGIVSASFASSILAMPTSKLIAVRAVKAATGPEVGASATGSWRGGAKHRWALRAPLPLSGWAINSSPQSGRCEGEECSPA